MMKHTYLSKFRFVPVIALLLLSVLSAWAQDRRVTGKVTDGETSGGLPGVSIVIKGTQTGVNTDVNGNYAISVSGANPILVFSFVGYEAQEIAVGSRSQIDVTLMTDVKSLQEVVVTGYTTERKKDIIGSVSVINTKTMVSQPNSNLSSMMQGRAAGITVSGTGAPGAASKIRIRGFVSFGNNDPLYVIDGVPTDNANNLNPQDVASIQVLKDPVSASIYGSRAANGVIVVTTKQGGTKSEISYDGYYGVQQIPDRAYPKMLNTAEYYEFLQRSFQGAGVPFKSNVFGKGIPQYLVTSMDVNQRPTDGTNPDLTRYRVNPDANPDSYGPYQIYNTSPGTDWFREVTRAAPMQSHQISATGGSDKGSYSLGLNYFGQQGTFIETNYNRYTLRANTRFKPTKFLTVGENFQLAYTDQYGGSGNPQDLGGGLDFSGEGSPWAQSYRMVPYIPVRDINGNWGGNGVGESGNGTNPVAAAYRGRGNRYAGFNLLGNVYASINIMKDITLSSSFGFDQRLGNGYNFTYITYERAENQKNNAFSEYFFRGGSWTWTNSVQYQKTFAEKHNLKLFGATEAIFEQFRSISGSRNDYDFSDESFRSLNTGKNLPQNGGSPSTPRTLYSVFGKVEYQFNDRYLFSATVRQDAASVFGPENRKAIFPAFGVGWRISEESFMKSLSFISDLKIRGGWGQMGSQRNVGAANAFSFFGANIGGTAYDITGGNGAVAIGYRPSVAGNPSTKWEAAQMVNVGLDGSLFNGKIDFTLEYFNNTTKDLLVGRQRNGLEPLVGQPQINVGTMVNKGFDGTISTRGNVGGSGLSYDVAITMTHFKNIAEKLDAEGSAFFEFGAGRLGAVQRTEAGRALSTFRGYIIDGIFQTQAEVDAHAAMSYKRVGSWKIRDINGDKVINASDQTFIGSPIPKFQMGTDIVLKYKNFDFNAFLYWNYGNQIFNYTKWWTHLRGFVGGVSKDALYDSWTPQNTGASLPILNTNDNFSGAISSTYYLEPGSYLRARQVQLGYTFPAPLLKKLGVSRARVYVQGQNLFTITKYTGPDPDINIQGGELTMGVDQFRTPSPSVYIVGFNFGF